MKISFDFDGTLSRWQTQDYAAKLKFKGHELIIVTSRNRRMSNDDLELVAERFDIKEIFYTDGNSKHYLLQEIGDVDIHIDDDPVELEMIRDHTSTIPMQCSIIGNESLITLFK